MLGGTAPIKIETGRYQNLDLSERVCFHCASCIEDEEHVLMVCPIYEDLRMSLVNEAMLVNPALVAIVICRSCAFFCLILEW